MSDIHFLRKRSISLFLAFFRIEPILHHFSLRVTKLTDSLQFYVSSQNRQK